MIKTPCRRALIHAGVYFVGRELTVSDLQDLSALAALLALPALPDHEPKVAFGKERRLLAHQMNLYCLDCT